MLKLKTTDNQFNGLYAVLDKTRRSSKTAIVDRAALTALLLDHSELLATVKHEVQA